MAHRDPMPDGTCPIIEEYVEARLHISGMPHIISLLEFANNNFVNWDYLKELNLYDQFTRLNRVVGLTGCLMNDLFSFEKEVIDNGLLSNLVTVVYLTQQENGLEAAIISAVDIVRDLLTEFAQLSKSLTEKISTNEKLSQDMTNSYLSYIHALSKVVVACWYWQCATKRYKRVDSIFMECRL